VTPLGWICGGGIAALLLLALAERGARQWIRRRARYYVWAPGTRRDYRISPDVSPLVEARVRFEVNRDGERGRDVNGADRGLYRILVAGGSPTESLAQDQPTSWPGALERTLGTPEGLRTLGATSVHVGNIGRSGVGAEELDLIFKRVLPRYRRLDAILIMVGAADVFHWLERGAPSPYPAMPVPVQRIFACHPEGRFGWRPAQWALTELMRRLRHRWLRPVEFECGGEWIAPARAMRANAREMRTTVPDPSVMLNRFEEHLRRLLHRARGHARRVILVQQPWFEKDYYAPSEASTFWQGGVGIPWRERVSVYYSLDVMNRLMRLAHARAGQVAEQMGIECFDLLPVVPSDIYHYYDFGHFTPVGATVVARAIATAVLQTPAVSLPSRQTAMAGSVPSS